MRTSLNDIAQIDAFLAGKLSPPAEETIRERMRNDFAFRLSVRFQMKLNRLVQRYARRRLLADAAAVHENIFADPANREYAYKIHQLFN